MTVEPIAKEVPVFVPAPSIYRNVLEAGRFLRIDAGSGVVGTRRHGSDGVDYVLVDFEGNRFGYANVVTFADRCWQAWGRHSTSYPTAARHWLTENLLVQVGAFSPANGEIVLRDTHSTLAEHTAAGLLASWLEVDEVDPAELRCSGGEPGAAACPTCGTLAVAREGFVQATRSTPMQSLGFQAYCRSCECSFKVER